MPGATALAQARASGAFTASHQRYWDATRRAPLAMPGHQALIEVLLAHRTLPVACLIEAMDAAATSGILSRGRDHRRPPPRQRHHRPSGPGCDPSCSATTDLHPP